MTTSHTLVGLPEGLHKVVSDGAGLRSSLRSLGIDIESICAENATCGKCKVVVEEGEFAKYGVVSARSHLSPAGPEEAYYFRQRPEMLTRRGWNAGQVRLACQAKIQGDVVITVPEESRSNRQIVRKTAAVRAIDLLPAVRKYLVELNAPTLANPKADWERLASGLATSMALVRSGDPQLPKAADLGIDNECLRTLPDVLRAAGWRVTVSVWQDREVIRVEPGYTERLLGAAVDIGTTTLALYLCDLASGETLATESDMNPQIQFGEDVMSRIQFAIMDAHGLEQLHKSIIKAVNQLLLRAVHSASASLEDVVEMVVVGNTTMHHLFLNLTPRHLGIAPFAPAVFHSLDVKARELRIAANKAANVHVLPVIASFIGADTTGVLLAEAPHEQDEVWLVIDIGTNAELVLGNRHELICASTPTGPAFEGAHLEHGMRAAPGAIEHFRIDDASLVPHWKAIGEQDWDTGRPKGLCGSAVVDAVAELVRVGIVDGSGRFVEGSGGDRLQKGPGGLEYIIAVAPETSIDTDIRLTQKDIRQIQLAKAALFVAAQTLMDRYGIQAPDKILLAGAFGSYMDRANAMAIGMLPELALQKVYVVGNAAGDGARIALLNRQKRLEAAHVAQRLTRHELPADPEFQARYIQALAFPPARRESGGKDE